MEVGRQHPLGGPDKQVGEVSGSKLGYTCECSQRTMSRDLTAILMAAGDTFRAATSDQLDIWAERTGIVFQIVLSQALKKGKEQEFDIVLSDTSGCLHTNYSLMEELIAYKKVVGKIVRGTANVVGITGFILTKLDGSARSGCVMM
ncbi:hypothetical protein OIU79_016074 [Salix purpurea]|uniref:SRP54-type proteins GTP-binding domain-containing protein n=1 Tax=Salix purpurea TaxID=77065 RepID=A0A9Q0SQP4_SALPP|nr:hypothetical protein OIU79_016074 [Salix purpurea]